MTGFSIREDLVQGENAARKAVLDDDYAALARALERRGIDSEALVRKVMAFGVAIPTWGVGTGGTRFARFPGTGEPRHIFDKLEDCATIHQLVRATPTISPHFPWDTTSDYAALREAAAASGLAFDAVNSNTFQDHPNQEHSYKFG
jgi:L-rhamnose isomerase/sugar isomerase